MCCVDRLNPHGEADGQRRPAYDREGSNSVVEDCDGLIQEDQAHNAMSALIDLVAKLS